jgi:hypothetical protein
MDSEIVTAKFRVQRPKKMLEKGHVFDAVANRKPSSTKTLSRLDWAPNAARPTVLDHFEYSLLNSKVQSAKTAAGRRATDPTPKDHSSIALEMTKSSESRESLLGG